MQDHLPGFPVQTVEIVHQLGGVGRFQHLQLWEGGATVRLERMRMRSGRQNASLVLRSGDGARRLLLLHGGMVLYLGSLVPNSALTEKEAGHMLTHTVTHAGYLSLSLSHSLLYERQD